MQTPLHSPSSSPPPKRIKLESPPSPSISHHESDHEGEPLEDQCSICLQQVTDRTVLPTCAHEFCFECILMWSEQSRRCPLCSQSLGEHLIHHIRSKFDYQKHYLAPLRKSSPSPSPLLPLRNTIRTRRRTLREREWGRRQTQEREEADALDRAIEKRRWIYKHDLYAKHVASNSYTRYRPYPTPAQFAASADLISRTTSFLRRELRVWVNLDVEFLTTFIISIMKAIDIRSESAVKLLAEFLDLDAPYVAGGRHINAEHFAHEVYSYVRSPYKDLFVYDTIVQYDAPPDIPPPPVYRQPETRWHSPPRSRQRQMRSQSRDCRREPGRPRSRSRSLEDFRRAHSRPSEMERPQSREYSWSPSGQRYVSSGNRRHSQSNERRQSGDDRSRYAQEKGKGRERGLSHGQDVEPRRGNDWRDEHEKGKGETREVKLHDRVGTRNVNGEDCDTGADIKQKVEKGYRESVIDSSGRGAWDDERTNEGNGNTGYEHNTSAFRSLSSDLQSSSNAPLPSTLPSIPLNENVASSTPRRPTQTRNLLQSIQRYLAPAAIRGDSTNTEASVLKSPPQSSAAGLTSPPKQYPISREIPGTDSVTSLTYDDSTLASPDINLTNGVPVDKKMFAPEMVARTRARYANLDRESEPKTVTSLPSTPSPNATIIGNHTGVPSRYVESHSAPASQLPDGLQGRVTMSAPDIMARTRARIAKLDKGRVSKELLVDVDSNSPYGDNASDRRLPSAPELPSARSRPGVNADEHQRSVDHANSNRNNNGVQDEDQSDKATDHVQQTSSRVSPPPLNLRARLLDKLEDEKRHIQDLLMTSDQLSASAFSPQSGDGGSRRMGPSADLPTTSTSDSQNQESRSVETKLRARAELQVRLALLKRDTSTRADHAALPRVDSHGDITSYGSGNTCSEGRAGPVHREEQLQKLLKAKSRQRN